MSERVKDRLPLAIAIAAMLLAVLGLSPAGEAARQLVQRVSFARDTRAVNGIQASRTPRPNRLLPLGADRRFPASVVPTLPGARGPQGPAGAQGQEGAPGRDGGRAIVVLRDDPLVLPADGSAATVLTIADLEPGAFLITAAVEVRSTAIARTIVRCVLARGGRELGTGAVTVGTTAGGATVAVLPVVAGLASGERATVILRCAAEQPGAVVDVEQARAAALRVESVTDLEVLG